MRVLHALKSTLQCLLVSTVFYTFFTSDFIFNDFYSFLQDGENWTVIHVAASMDDMDAAKLIVKHCLTKVCNVDGERSIDLAESNDMAQLLLVVDLRTL